MALHPADTIDLACQHTDPATTVLGCVPGRSDGVTVIFRIPEAWGLRPAQLATVAAVGAHELCHAVRLVLVQEYLRLEPFLVSPRPAALEALVARYRDDRCHDEDRGVYRP